MKLLLPLLSVVMLSGTAFAQTQPDPAPSKPSIPSTPIFRDVPPNHWAFAAVQRLASAGIVEGYGDSVTPTTRVVAKVAPARAATHAASHQAAKATAKVSTKVSAKPSARKTTIALKTKSVK